MRQIRSFVKFWSYTLPPCSNNTGFLRVRTSSYERAEHTTMRARGNDFLLCLAASARGRWRYLKAGST